MPYELDEFREDKFHDECGIFGVFGHKEASNLTYLGLYALQHRGQEGAGIVSSDGKQLFSEKGMGLVADIFAKDRIARLPGEMAIGHNRYSTTGVSHVKNVQPITANYALGTLALAHNGNLTNAGYLRDELEAYGSIFQSSTDSEVIVHLIAQARGKNFIERILDALGQIKGAYSLLIMSPDRIVVARDPYGIRPLALGRLDGAYVVASETCAFDLIEAEYIRDVEPGEVLIISAAGLESIYPFKPVAPTPCVFEFIYFSRPDSNIFGGRNVNRVRKVLGAQLARETGVDADLVIPVPDSGVPAALGFAEEAKIPFDFGLIRNHYVGRTFIEPQQSIRHFGVKIKLNAVRDLLEGKRVVVVDDSIVRGTTSKKIVKMIRAAGAKEVHLRISSPPTSFPCYYGIDTPTRQELIASSHSLNEICKYVTADSLGYLSVEGMLDIIPDGRAGFCTACFDGNYPVEFPWEGAEQPGLFDR